MVKSKECTCNAIKNQNVLAVKVQYGTVVKLITLGCLGNILEKQHFLLKTVNRVGKNVSLTINKEKMARSDNWFRSYDP
jgi:hypothetical protein